MLISKSNIDFNYKTTKLRGNEAKYYQFNTVGKPAYFYGANGFPIGSYSELLKPLLAKYKLSGLELRACWPNIGKPPKQTNWETYAYDLIDFIEQNFNEPIVGIAHSQGATASIIAASKRPDLFEKLYVIEPAFISKAYALFVRLVPYFMKKKQQPMKGALIKKSTWETKQEFIEDYRKNRAYKRVGGKVLNDFADFGLKQLDNGKFTLVFPAEWEASNYALAPSILKYLKKVKIPIHVIAGKPSLFFSKDLREKWKQVSPNSTLDVNMDYGHLFPLEAPEICANMILE